MMGSDAAVVQAARVSLGQGTKSPEEDEKLIRYLMRHKHTSPFEMVEFKFHIQVPIFIARQWMRHRTASINERSARYGQVQETSFNFRPEDITAQSTSNKQGDSGETLVDAKQYALALNAVSAEVYDTYQFCLEQGMRREIARAILPQSMMTEFYWKIDLHNLLHFLNLRLDSGAQKEIREPAQLIADILKEKVPVTWKAFEDYVLNSVTLSASELKCLEILIDAEQAEKILSKREAEELVNKLYRRI
jgi:thymidylate synthase (FAD)